MVFPQYYGQGTIDLAISKLGYEDSRGRNIPLAGDCTTSNYLTDCYLREETGIGYIVQHNKDALAWEDFADMFSGYVYGFADNGSGRARYNWMDSQMSRWISLAIDNNRQKGVLN